jgi:hypothetical protein
MPEDAIELTIERQTTSLAAMIQSVAIPEPPVDSPPIQPALPVPRQPVPQVESAQTPTLENAVPEPEPPPEPTLRDFPKVEPVVRKMESAQTPTLENAVPKPEPTPELTSRDFPKVAPVVRKMEQKKPSPKSDPKPDLNKAPEPPGGTSPNASPPTPLPNPADVVQPNKARDEYLARMLGTRYLERMGIKPSHQATMTEKSGDTCPRDPDPYKLEITNNKLTVTNQYGKMFSISVPADGEIYQHYKRPPMAGDRIALGKWMEYTMKGNVKTGKLEIWHIHCVYKLNPT